MTTFRLHRKIYEKIDWFDRQYVVVDPFVSRSICRSTACVYNAPYVKQVSSLNFIT